MTKKKDLTTGSIVQVHFHTPKDGANDYFFGSLTAIFNKFDEAEIGCALSSLYQYRITFDRYKVTDTCMISKHRIYRSKRGRGVE